MKIFYNILKRKSISKLIKNLPDGSYYLMPWENRGYQLGIEKDESVLVFAGCYGDWAGNLARNGIDIL